MSQKGGWSKLRWYENEIMMEERHENINYWRSVLGCNMAHNFYVAGKDVTLFARGAWGQNIKERGLIIKNKFSLRSTCDKISVIDKLSREDEYDVIFICLRYTQVSSIIDTLKENATKNIVFVGNNMNALAGELEKMTVSAGVKADNFNELKKYINKYFMMEISYEKKQTNIKK